MGSGTESAPADRRGTGKKGGDEAVAAAKAKGEKGKQLVKARVAGKRPLWKLPVRLPVRNKAGTMLDFVP